MPKLGMGPVRRRQLVNATIASIHQYGLADATVTRIAKKAGVSSGIVHHYFADKDALLYETMRVMLASLRQEVISRLKTIQTPRQRLQAIVDASFCNEQFTPQVVTAWLGLYASARQSQNLTAILTLYHRRLHSNLVYAFKQLDGADSAHFHAKSIGALIDGLYLRAALNPQLGDMNSQKLLAAQMIEHLLSSTNFKTPTNG